MFRSVAHTVRTERRRVLVAPLALLAVLTMPMLADGKTAAKKKAPAKPRFSHVEVGYTGNGTFKQVDLGPEGYGVTITGNFAWDVTYLKPILVRDVKGKVSSPFTGVPIDMKQSKASGNWMITVRNQNGDGDCTASGGFALRGAGTSAIGNGGGIQLTQTGQTFHIGLDVASTPELMTTGAAGGDGSSACDQRDVFGAITSSAQIGTRPDGSFVDPLHTDVDGLTFGEHLTRQVGADASQRRSGDSGCGLSDGSTCTFAFDWHGQVTADPACDADYGVTRRASVRAAATCEAVYAKLDDPGATTRGQSVTLDATASGPKKAAIKRYEFLLAPGPGCPPKTHLTHTVMTDDGGKASKVSFQVLCPIVARVKVTDKDGHTTTSDPVTAEVRARGGTHWKATVKRTQESSFRGSFQAPTGRLTAGGVEETWNTTFGENFGGPGHVKAVQHGSILAPYNTVTYKTDGYDPEQINDPHGPFDNFWWVKSTSIGIDRQECVNPFLAKGGPKPPGATENWYSLNRRKGVDVAALLRSVRAHEGLGDKTGVGHTAILQARLAKDDPRKKLETYVQSDKYELYNEADKYLLDLDATLAKATEDGPGRTIDGQAAATYTGDYWVFVPANESWVKVSGSL